MNRPCDKDGRCRHVPYCFRESRCLAVIEPRHKNMKRSRDVRTLRVKGIFKEYWPEMFVLALALAVAYSIVYPI